MCYVELAAAFLPTEYSQLAKAYFDSDQPDKLWSGELTSQLIDTQPFFTTLSVELGREWENIVHIGRMQYS